MDRPAILLIHGLWMTPLSWENFAGHYADAGYEVLAPGWPGLADDVESVRADPGALAGLGLAEVVDHYARLAGALATPPLLIGHSFGGLVVQQLLDRGYGLAGAAIHSAMPRGVLTTPPAALRSAWPVLRNPANRRRAVPLTFPQFRYAFTNTLDAAAARAAYDRYAIPGSGRMVFQAALANLNPRAVTTVDYRNPDRAPLLLVAGSADHVIPAAVNRANHRRYRRSPAVTDYVEFPGRSHLTVGEPGWERVADHVLTWAASLPAGNRREESR